MAEQHNRCSMNVENIYKSEPQIYKALHVIQYIIRIIKSVFFNALKSKFRVTSGRQKTLDFIFLLVIFNPKFSHNTLLKTKEVW